MKHVFSNIHDILLSFSVQPQTNGSLPMLPSRELLARRFFETSSFKHDPINKFKLSSGELSPFYVDCKNLVSVPEARNLLAELAYKTLRSLPSFDCIGGLEIGSIAMTTTISDRAFRSTPSLSWPTFVVRKLPKEHGLKKLIEGSVEPGWKAVIVDDVLTSGGSVIKAIEAARDAQLTVTDVLVIVDREEQQGRQKVEIRGVKLHSLLTIRDLEEAARPALVSS